MKGKLNLNLSVNKVYYTNHLILLVKNMRCSKLHCQKDFDAILFLHKISHWRELFSRRPLAPRRSTDSASERTGNNFKNKTFFLKMAQIKAIVFCLVSDYGLGQTFDASTVLYEQNSLDSGRVGVPGWRCRAGGSGCRGAPMLGTRRTFKSRFWPWLEPFSVRNLRYSFLARQRTWVEMSRWRERFSRRPLAARRSADSESKRTGNYFDKNGRSLEKRLKSRP